MPKRGLRNSIVASQLVKVAHRVRLFCNFMEYEVHEILQARTLEWVAFSFSRGSPQPRDQT